MRLEHALETLHIKVQLGELVTDAETRLVAFFPQAQLDGSFSLDGAQLGPAKAIAETARIDPPVESGETGSELGVMIRDPRGGRLGAVHAVGWLQTVLGALGLAAYDRWQGLGPVATCPSQASACLVAAGDEPPVDVDIGAALFRDTPGQREARRLADRIREPEAHPGRHRSRAKRPCPTPSDGHRALATDCLDPAIRAADALVALGVALESLTGDDNKGAVLERVTKRAATFLAIAFPAGEMRGRVLRGAQACEAAIRLEITRSPRPVRRKRN